MFLPMSTADVEVLTRYVSVQVSGELRERMRELGIEASKVLRRAIEEEVRRREIEKVKEVIEELKPTLTEVSVEEVVRSIRQDRERG